MMGYWHDASGTDYVWMIGMMLLWLAVIVGAVWAVITLTRRDPRPGQATSAREELDRSSARRAALDHASCISLVVAHRISLAFD